MAPGVRARRGLLPFDLIRAVNGRIVTSGHGGPGGGSAGTPSARRFHYLGEPAGHACSRRTSRAASITLSDFARYVTRRAAAGARSILGLAAVVLALRPGAPDTRVFLFFSLTWSCTGRALPRRRGPPIASSALFLTAWAFAPAALPPHRAPLPAAAAHPVPPSPRSSGCPYGVSAGARAGHPDGPMTAYRRVAWTDLVPSGGRRLLGPWRSSSWSEASCSAGVWRVEHRWSGSAPRCSLAGFVAAARSLPVLGTADGGGDGA